ncbi:hypothetical protein Lalb_Chr00c29g0408111 (mitochondrion) [Lupinus albus]|uniref:Uncharacterized protein n=1 Tax=Lupinus albus TaxID=3870 RepID=A0A6A4N9L1_LUPAL|nr:hypothetical protein Lalb_Chr00c29g0408111 [Lupinus albus]
MPFLDTDLQTKSDEELASLKVALADLPVPLLSFNLLGGSSSSSLFFPSMPRAGFIIITYTSYIINYI